MILDATTKTIEVVLEGAITTNQCDVTSGFADSYPGGGFLPGEQDTATNGATPVTAVSAPAANVQRMVNEVRVYNKDTVAHTITIQLNDNGTRRVLQKQTAAAGTVVLYAPSGGNMQNIPTLDYVELEGGSTPVKISAMADLNLAGPPSASAKISAETGGTTNLGIQLDTLYKLFVDWLGYIATNPLDNGAGAGLAILLKTGAGGAGNSGALTLETGTATGGNSGAILVTSGTVSSGQSGQVVCSSANTTGTANSGNAGLVSGDTTAGTGNSGDAFMGSNDAGGTAGATNIFSGTSHGANAAGGPITIVCGSGTSGNANGGDITLTAGNGAGAGRGGNVNITLGTGGATTGSLQISNTWTANGAVATAVTGVGPTGSHTTVQEWFTIKNTAGTVRYIPAF